MSYEKAYYKVFPVTLFECFDETTPMHFIFSLKKQYKRLEEIIRILCHCGAKIGFNIKDVTNNSVLITDHNDVIKFYGPAFNIDYITDCLQSGKLQDIGKYRQEVTSHLVEESVCMQVVYYRKFGWDSVVKEEDKCWIDLNYKVKLFKHESVVCNGLPEVRMEDTAEENRILYNRAFVELKRNINNKMKSHTNEKISNRTYSKSKVDDNSVSKTVMDKIPVRESSDTSDSTLSPIKEMMEDTAEEKRILYNRAFVELKRNINNKMKSHTNEKISNRTDSKSKVDDNSVLKTVVDKIPVRESSDTSDSTLSPIKEMNTGEITKAGQSKCFPSYKPVASKGQDTNPAETNSKCKRNVESSSEDECKLGNSKRKGKIQNSSEDESKVASSGWMSKGSPQALHIKRSKLPLSLLNIEDSDSEEETKRSTCSKNSRRPYTKEERLKIVDYIVKHNEYSRIKGRELWMIMEKHNICPARTWQSMKEHFIKKIVRNIDSYDSLTNEQKRRIKQAYY